MSILLVGLYEVKGWLISYIKECLVVRSIALFKMWSHNNYRRKFWGNCKCECDQGNAILDGIEFWVSKVIYKDICVNVHGLSGWGFVCPSVSLSTLRSAILRNSFFSNLRTYKSQNFPMIAPRAVAKLSTSPKVTIFPPPTPYYFMSDQSLKSDRWTTLLLRNSMVVMDL